MAYKTSDKYKEEIYSGGTDNNLSFRYGEDYIEDSSPYISSLKLKNNLLKTTNTTFDLSNFVSNEIEIVVRDYPIEDLTKEFYFELGTLVDNEYEYVPIGYYKIKDNPTTAYGKTTYKLFDRAINFDFNYDAEPLITQNGGSVTILQILQDICSKAKVELATTDFPNKGKLVGIYDNSIKAREYVSYIAELACSVAKIGRDGKLHLIPIKKENNNAIELDEEYLNGSLTTGETFKVSKVVFENGITRIEKGDNTADTLFINSSNPFVSTQEDIDLIYNQIVGFEICSIDIPNMLGNVAIDPYDFIKFQLTDENENVTKEVLSLGQYEFTFDGVMKQKFITTINRTSKQSNISLKPQDIKVKRLKQELDVVEGALKITREEVNSNSSKISSLEIKDNEITSKVTSVENGLKTTNQNVSTLQASVDNVSADFEDFKDNEFINSIGNLQDQIDGAIQFWNGEEIPTINNYPANEWETEEERNNHRADIYTVIEDVDGELKQGKAYRFDKVDNTWQWIELTDNELSAVQAIAQEALDKSNKNIGDIQELVKKTSELSVKDEEITASVEEINNKYEQDITLTKEANGNPVVVTNAGPYKLESLKIEGKSYQETRSGANLLGGIDGVSGATDNKDGTYSQAITELTTIHWFITEHPITIPSGKDFYLSFDAKASSSQTKGINTIYCNDGTSNINGTAVANPNLSTNYQRYVFKINALDIEKTLTRISTQQSALDGATITYKNLMVSFNNVAYEQYGASPSPDFPSEIKNVEGVTNEFNIDLIPNVGVITNNGDGTLTLANNTNTVGYSYTETKLSTLMPNAIVGETYKLLFKSTFSKSVFYNTNIYLSGADVYLTSNNTFVLTQELLDSKLCLYGGYNEITTISDFIITRDLTCGNYFPYGRWLEVKSNGKNLLKYPYYYTTNTYNGITFTDNGDGSITIDGTSTSEAVFWLTNLIWKYDKDNAHYFPKGTYILNGTNNSYINTYIDIYSESGNHSTLYDYSLNGKTFTIDENSTGTIRVRIPSGKTIDNVTIYPMISVDGGEYEPYKETTALIDLNKENLSNGINQNYWVGASGTSVGMTASDTGLAIPINGAVNMTISTNVTQARYRVACVNTLPSDTTSSVGAVNGVNKDGSSSNITINTKGYNYLIVNVTDLSAIKVYEGYEPYYELSLIKDTKDTFKDGVLTQRIGKVVLDGSENWAFTTNGNAYYIANWASANNASTPPNSATKSKTLATHFINISRDDVYNLNNGVGIAQTGALNIKHQDFIKQDINAFKTWLSENNVEVYYILKEPIEHTLNYELLEMHEGYNNITTNDELEPNMSVTYLTDSKLNAKYATKSELKVTADNITSEINSTLKNGYTTIEQSNAIKQELTDKTNQINLEVSKKVDKTSYDTDKTDINAKLELKLEEKDKDKVVSMINASADEINLKSNRFSLESDRLNIAHNGEMEIISDDIYDNSSFVIKNSDGTLETRFGASSIGMGTPNQQYTNEKVILEDGRYSELVTGADYQKTILLDNTIHGKEYEIREYIDENGYHYFVNGVDLVNRFSNVDINTKTELGLNSSEVMYLRGEISDGTQYQCRQTPHYIQYQKWVNGNWSTLWGISGHVGEFLIASLNADFKITTASTYTTIPLTQQAYKVGTSLSLSNNGIKIGAGVSAVRIKAQYYFYTGTKGNKSLQIMKNSSVVVRTSRPATEQYTTIDCHSVINVTEGDIISIQASCAAKDLIKDYDHSTHLIVEVIR